jgi:ACS family hexuronate transporter-like MFS transporter
MSRVRWWILALLFFGTTLNYMNRMVMGILAPGLQKEYLISDVQYSYIQSAFAFCYAFGQMASGNWLDRIGTRLGYALALVGWSITSMMHALVTGVWSFCGIRALFGVTESPAFPAATKAVAEWFPRRERAFAFGFINAGTNMGVIGASLLVPWLATDYGWQWAFIVTGALGFVALLFWIPIYKNPAEHPKVSSAELAHINSDPPEPTTKIGWWRLVSCRQAWAFAMGKFLTDSMWWFYMTWFPKYLNKAYHLDLLTVGLPLVVIYLICDMGSIGGGWLSSVLIKRGATVNRARKTAMLVCAVGAVPIIFAQSITGVWPAILALGLVTACHQGFSANLYTLVSDMFPRRAVASVSGFGGTWGYFGASLFQLVVGYSVEKQHNYTIPFLCAGLAYLVAFAVIQILAPRLEPAKLEAAA